MDVVYNKVLMTSVEDDESERTKTPDKPMKHMSDEKAVGGQYKDYSQGDSSSQTKSYQVNFDYRATSKIPSLSTQSTSCESKRQQIKQNMKAKITKDEIRKNMEKVLKSGKYKMKVGRLIFWDFGGQYVYYTTHQTFMTFRALFLVVFDGSKGLTKEVPDVLCFPGQHLTPTPAGIPKILFVATHKDKVPMEDVETRRALLYSEVEELFKDHEGRNHLVLDKQIFVNATDKDDQEIEDPEEAITELTFDHPCWGEMPNSCVPLELEIAELVAQGKQILSLHEFEELNAISKVLVLNQRQLKDFLHFHHSLGKIVYFDSIHLRDYVIINPLLMVEKNNQCDENCQGLSDDALNQKPSDIELLRFSINFPSNQMFELVSYLNMFEKWNDITQNYPENIEAAKFLVLSKWREMEDGSNLKALEEALTNMDISTHILCQALFQNNFQIIYNTDISEIPLEYLDFIPTEEILDALAPQIGQVFFQLGAEVGLSIGTLENIKSNNPRDLAAQNREVLFAWREDRTVKPTIRVLVQALVNVGRGARCLQEVLKNVDLNTLGHSSDMGAIPKKPQGQKQRTSKLCAIA
ncbi:unnamed protein product [Mytilus edulis]|uniref:Death domain-containing protein n=1 Tax=Mytilus edulis TaxID=6550 RepID=A0A8S3U763_MYTED|nr:unnamed protein product [Mytilus edulis]